MFKSFLNKGFHFIFDNGVCVSVQFGPGNYCEHYIGWNNDYHTEFDAPKKEDMWKSEDAEIAIWKEFDEGESVWITHEFAKQADWVANYPDDFDVQVLGDVTSAQVLEALNWAQEYKEGK